MTKKQLREHKQNNARIRRSMLKQSMNKSGKGGNLIVQMGGVCQAGKY